jgi:hypothetical protein
MYFTKEGPMQKPPAGRAWIVAMVLAVVAITLGVWSGRHQSTSPATKDPAIVSSTVMVDLPPSHMFDNMRGQIMTRYELSVPEVPAVQAQAYYVDSTGRPRVLKGPFVRASGATTVRGILVCVLPPGTDKAHLDWSLRNVVAFGARIDVGSEGTMVLEALGGQGAFRDTLDQCVATSLPG